LEGNLPAQPQFCYGYPATAPAAHGADVAEGLELVLLLLLLWLLTLLSLPLLLLITTAAADDAVFAVYVIEPGGR
jgi:hypothetical protein